MFHELWGISNVFMLYFFQRVKRQASCENSHCDPFSSITDFSLGHSASIDLILQMVLFNI